MKKLKSVNFKQLLIDHGEKIVLGIVVLMSLMFVIGAEWSPESRTPQELETLVDKGKEAVKNSVWPESEMLKYTTQDTIGQKVEQMRTPIDVVQYSISTDTIWPLIKRHEPIKEPEYVAVEDLQVIPGQGIFRKAPEMPSYYDLVMNEGTTTEGAGGGTKNRMMIGLKPKEDGTNGSGAFGVGPAAPGLPGPLAGRGPAAGKAGPGAISPRDPGRFPSRGAGAGDPALPGAFPGGDGYGEDPLLAELKNIEGRRFNAVTGVVNVRAQIDKFSKARNESIADSRPLLEYLHFYLERQKAVPGPDPWAGPWEPVDMKAAEDVLTNSNGFELDFVEETVTDPVFTMPLPELAVDSWERYASHPRVRNFELTEEGRARQQQLNEYLMKQEELLQEQLKEMGPQKRGFASHKFDIRGMSRSIAGSANALDDFRRSFMSETNDPNVNKELEERLKKVSAGGTLMLFRYFDFDVAPGNAYRYRVKLELANPNYGLSPDQVVAPHVAEGQVRETPWSKPSNPAVTGEEVVYFLARVDPGRNKSLPAAMFDIFQYNEKTGTPVNDERSRAIIGQRIGGTAKKKIVAPPVRVSEDEFTFNTGDFLLDVAETALIEDREFASFHTDLNFGSDPRNRPSLVEKVLVANDFGEMVMMDGVTRKRDERQWQKEYEQMVEIWEEQLGDGQEAGGTPADLLAAKAGMLAKDDPGNKKGSRRTDPSRRRGGAGDRGGAAVPGAFPGAGGVPGGANVPGGRPGRSGRRN